MGQPSTNSLYISSVLWVSELGSVLYILTHFRTNRSQHIMVDGYRSKLVNIVSVVPQCFGPVIVPTAHLAAFFCFGK